MLDRLLDPLSYDGWAPKREGGFEISDDGAIFAGRCATHKSSDRIAAIQQNVCHLSFSHLPQRDIALKTVHFVRKLTSGVTNLAR